MSSSDSEEDCYGNVAKTLQNLKSKYKGDKLCSVNLLESSLENDKFDPPATSKENSKIVVENTELSNVNNSILDNSLTEDEELDRIIQINSRRVTRSSSNCISTVGKKSPVKRKTRNSNKRGCKRKSDEAIEDTFTPDESNIALPPNYNINTSAAPVASIRGSSRRGRARNNAKRGRNIPIDQYMNPWLPTYSVGNTDEYPDQSDNVQLFSTLNRNPDIVVIEDTQDTFDENEELSVKVHWQSSEIVKFSIRKYQKLLQIFEFFAKKANVSSDKLFFTYNDKILQPADTPDSIDYNIAKFIDGGIVNNSVSKLMELTTDKNIPDGIKLKFQYPNSKKPFEIRIQKDDILSMAMIKCAEHMEMPLKSLKFEFDGDSITGKDTAKDLDMEGGECIDVKIIR